jgi:hypothetical protein
LRRIPARRSGGGSVSWEERRGKATGERGSTRFCSNARFVGEKEREREITRLGAELWQNRLNYSGSSVLMIAVHLQTVQRTSNGTIPWSVGSPPDTTTVQQDRSRFTSHEGEFTSQKSSSTFNLQPHIHYYKSRSQKSKFIQTMFKLTSITACPIFTAEEKVHATTHVAKADTKLSPGPGVTSEGHCRPGTGPIPRTSQKERTLATQGCPWDSRRSYLK